MIGSDDARIDLVWTNEFEDKEEGDERDMGEEDDDERDNGEV